MRIIAGTAKGHRISCLDGQSIRPTQDRIREAIFSSLALRISQAKVLDLFAGTGAMGLEALSRGAQEAVFIDKDPQSCAIIKENSKYCKLDGAKIFKQDVIDFLNSMDNKQVKYDIIFADPPYYKDYYDQLLLAINQSLLLSQDGILVVEAPKKLELATQVGNLYCYKTRSYGITTIYYYEYQN